MKEVDKMTNEGLNKIMEAIIIIAETTGDINKVIEYLKRIQAKK